METLKKKTLFWDTDSLDSQKHRTFIIERVLNFGDLDDYKWAERFYGREKIKKVVLESRGLGRKALFFWCQYFNIDKSKCLQKQLAAKQNAFWKK